MGKLNKGQFGYDAQFATDYSRWASIAGKAGAAARASAGAARPMTAEALAKKIDLERRARGSTLRAALRSGIQNGVREGRQPEVPFASDPRFMVQRSRDNRNVVKAPPETEPCEANRIWSMESVPSTGRSR